MRSTTLPLLAAFIAAPAAHAADLSVTSSKSVVQAAAASETPDVPGGDIFGFTSGADVGKVGDRGVALENSGAYGARDGRWRGLSQKLEFSGTFVDRWSFAASLFGNWTSLSSTLDPHRNGYNFDGVSVEARYRAIDRSATNPFALTLAVEPRWARIDPLTGLYAPSFGAEFKAQVDAPVADRLYWAMNANFATGRSRDVVDRTWSNASDSSLSTALTYEAMPDKFFVGVEARWQQAWSAGFFGRLDGQAVFFGPTFAWKPSDNVMLNAVFLPQLGGKARGVDGPFDVDNFNRANYRVKLAIGF